MNYPEGDTVRLLDIVDGGDGPAVVVGIAESGEYAPGYQFEVIPRCDAGVLVVAQDRSLKWRPLPGAPLIRCERPQVEHQHAASRQGPGLLPASALPPYHGFYVDGQRIELRDVVRLSQKETGRVVAIISENLFSPDFKAEEWAYLRFGFLVDSTLSGIQWYRDADEDLELVARA